MDEQSALPFSRALKLCYEPHITGCAEMACVGAVSSQVISAARGLAGLLLIVCYCWKVQCYVATVLKLQLCPPPPLFFFLVLYY